MFTVSLRIGAIGLIVASALATGADAQGNRSRDGGGSAGRSAPTVRSAPSFRSAPAVRSSPSFRSAPVQRYSAPATRRSVTPQRLRRSPVQITRPQSRTSRSVRRGVTTQRSIVRQKGTPRIVRRAPGKSAITSRTVRAGALKQNRTAAIRSSVLRNRAFVGSSKASARTLARNNFRGQFAGKRFPDPRWAHFHRHRHHRHIFVIGWIGPLFWPYAYDDFIDYTYWPYGYDTFWPYAYDDLYVSLYGPYAYVGGAYASAPAYREGGRVQRVPRGGVAQVCSTAAAGLTDWPIERIAQAVEPNEAQRALLNELKSATAGAVEAMQSACPSDLPNTPTGRLAAMRARIETMLKAVAFVQPALARFYGSLSDEQKARFNAVPDATRRTRAATQRDLTQACGADATARIPIDRVRRAVRPTDTQGAALDELDQASRRAADLLKASCEGEESLTPTGRIAAMNERLKAMLQALDIVQPALDRFYGSLSDEQKARFNRLPRQG